MKRLRDLRKAAADPVNWVAVWVYHEGIVAGSGTALPARPACRTRDRRDHARLYPGPRRAPRRSRVVRSAMRPEWTRSGEQYIHGGKPRRSRRVPPGPPCSSGGRAAWLR
ncbi:hypothetical protein HBB16_04420 [Pseudonocardia sp. MCCB 268]|nr:hypothetical protein [Pseudonocardia cytotoxica]